jgi:zinc transport system substrate-binding protein
MVNSPRKRFIFMVIMLSLSVRALFAGGEKEEADKSGKPQVVTVNFPAYDFSRQIAGDQINLTMLLPPGAESHSLEPTPRDIIKIKNCAVFIYTGGESDEWVDRILKSMDVSKKKIVRMMEAVDLVKEEIIEGMEKEKEENIAYDEHIWTSPKNAVRIVRAIANALCEADAANASFFRKNAESYAAELEKLDAEFQAVVNGAKRKIIIFGDRFPFRYFTDAYGLKYYAAFPGCSTETEPSAATVAFLINKIRAEKIPVVFYIELSNEKMADTIAAETGAKKLIFHSCHNITKRDFDQGVTFLEIQKANVPRLREALQ